jgi:hypothetical protein
LRPSSSVQLPLGREFEKAVTRRGHACIDLIVDESGRMIRVGMQRVKKIIMELRRLTYLIEAEAFSGSVPREGFDEAVEFFARISELGQILA